MIYLFYYAYIFNDDIGMRIERIFRRFGSYQLMRSVLWRYERRYVVKIFFIWRMRYTSFLDRYFLCNMYKIR